MKDFLILATITIIIGVFIPSKGALALFGIILYIVFWIAGKLGARGLQRVQEVPNENPNRKPDGTCMNGLAEVSAEFRRRYGNHSNTNSRYR